MLIFFLFIIVLYGSKIESQEPNHHLYTLVELTQEYPWLFDEAADQARTGEKNIVIRQCRLESKYLLWPAQELRSLLLESVSFADAFDLSPIPSMKYLRFQSIDHNSASILKACTFPARILELTFDRNAVRCIRFIQAENFALQVKIVRIHIATYDEQLPHEQKKTMKVLAQLLRVNQALMVKKMLRLWGFFQLEVRDAQAVPSSSSEWTKVTIDNNVYNGERLQKDYPWLVDDEYPWLEDKHDSEHVRTILITKGRLDNQSINWPSVAIFSIVLDYVNLSDAFDFSTVPRVHYFTLQKLDHNSAQILRQCRFPRSVFELTFSEDAVRLIHFIQLEYFPSDVAYIKIHGPTYEKLLAYEKKKIFNKLCELLEIDPTKTDGKGIFLAKGCLQCPHCDLYTIDVHKYKPPPIVIEPIDEDAIITPVKTIPEHIFISSELSHTEVLTVDLRTYAGPDIVISNYLLTNTIHWPERPVRKLSFVDNTFLAPFDLSNIPFVEQLSFYQLGNTMSDVLQQSKLPPLVENLIFGENAAWQLLSCLQPDWFPDYVQYILIDAVTFTNLDRETQDCLLGYLCQLLTQTNMNLECCVHYLREEYFDTIRNGYFGVDATTFSAIDARKFIFGEDLKTYPVNLRLADEITFMNLQLKSSVIIWPTTDIFSIIFLHVTLLEPFDLSSIPKITALTFHQIDHNPSEMLTRSKFPHNLRSLTLQEHSLSIINFIAPENFANGVEVIFVHQKSFQELSTGSKDTFMMNLITLICSKLDNKEHIRVCSEIIHTNMHDNKKPLIFGGLIEITLLE